MIVMGKTITAKTRRLAEDVLEMLDEPILSVSQRLSRIEKEMKRRQRLRSGKNKK